MKPGKWMELAQSTLNGLQRYCIDIKLKIREGDRNTGVGGGTRPQRELAKQWLIEHKFVSRPRSKSTGGLLANWPAIWNSIVPEVVTCVEIAKQCADDWQGSYGPRHGLSADLLRPGQLRYLLEAPQGPHTHRFLLRVNDSYFYADNCILKGVKSAHAVLAPQVFIVTAITLKRRKQWEIAQAIERKRHKTGAYLASLNWPVIDDVDSVRFDRPAERVLKDARDRVVSAREDLLNAEKDVAAWVRIVDKFSKAGGHAKVFAGYDDWVAQQVTEEFNKRLGLKEAP